MFQEPGLSCNAVIKPEIPLRFLQETDISCKKVAYFCKINALSCKMLKEIFQGS